MSEYMYLYSLIFHHLFFLLILGKPIYKMRLLHNIGRGKEKS